MNKKHTISILVTISFSIFMAAAILLAAPAASTSDAARRSVVDSPQPQRAPLAASLPPSLVNESQKPEAAIAPTLPLAQAAPQAPAIAARSVTPAAPLQPGSAGQAATAAYRMEPTPLAPWLPAAAILLFTLLLVWRRVGRGSLQLSH